MKLLKGLLTIFVLLITRQTFREITRSIENTRRR